jgi:predicted TIM-barrel fold metal-dependent hydrolase
VDRPLIDCSVHHRWATQAELMEYMDAATREFIGQPGSLPNGGGAIPVVFQPPYRHPGGDDLRPGAAASAPLGTSAEDVAAELFERRGFDSAVLCYGDPMMAPAIPNPHIAQAVIRAANDWTVDRWLDHDERFKALVLVASQTTTEAVAEIERLAGRDQFVGVLLAANALSHPFGHPAYRPIFEAAAEQGLTVVLQAGGDAIPEALSMPTAGGVPTAFGEYYALSVQAMTTHVVSLIGQGLFDFLPDLKVVVSGVGVGWIPALFWRFDSEYVALRREAPWMRQPPSDYLRQHLYVCTHPLDRPADSGALVRLIDAFPGLGERLVFGSGYPGWDSEWPEEVAELLPDAAAGLFGDTAREAFPRLALDPALS